MYKSTGKLVLILLFSAIISYTYLEQAIIPPQQVAPVFGLRFLLPSAIAFVLPLELYDTKYFRFAFAFVSVALSFVAIQRFGRKLILNDNDSALDPVLPLAFLLILLCHYTLTKELNVYYVYDFPAILFYMLSFLLLTSTSSRVVIFGIFFTVLFSLNRETIVIAPFHAAAFVLCRDWSNLHQSVARTLGPIVSTVVIIFLLRILLAYSIYGVGLLSTITTHEDETLRFFANVQRVINYHEDAFHLLLFGAGALVWLPLFFPYIGNQLKLMLLFSIPVFLMLLWAGNFVEMRIYNEFVPILTVLLSQAIVQFFNNHEQKISSGSYSDGSGPSCDEPRRIAANVAKLPGLVRIKSCFLNSVSLFRSPRPPINPSGPQTAGDTFGPSPFDALKPH